MKSYDFRFIHERGEVSIVREKSASVKSGSQPIQRIKVMCFDVAQVDRIFRIQENTVKASSKNIVGKIKKYSKDPAKYLREVYGS